MSLPETQEELDAIINRALAPKLSRISELEAEVGELTSERDEAVTNLGSANEQITTLQGDVQEGQRALLVKDVAHKKGVRERWLSGDTEEELIASADEYLADARATLGAGQITPTGTVNPPAGGSDPGAPGKQEVVPSAGTGEETPAKPTYQERLQEAYEKAQQEGAKGVTI